MITVDITVNDEGKVTDVVMDGHANHGEYGHDIVCAGAVSYTHLTLPTKA